MINLHAIYHTPKSNMAYPIDKHTLKLTIRCAKDDFDEIYCLGGDPHDYYCDEFDNYHWVIKKNPHILMEKRFSNELFDFYSINCNVIYSRFKYAFLLIKGNDKYFYGPHGIKKVSEDFNLYNNFEYFSFPYLNEEDITSEINWVKDTIWYQIFPERFCNSGNNKDYLKWDSIEKVKNTMFFGGNLKGVMEKLDYIKDLGFNGIYFTPIFESPSTHKYDTTDYFKIDPQFGTNEEFKQLVKMCHERQIKVMLDAVFNHCGFSHSFFLDVVKNGKDSKYIDAFYFYDKDNLFNFEIKNNIPISKKNSIPSYETFAFTPFMPKIKSSHPIWQEYLLDVCKYWIKEYDIDGWRLDVSNEVSHDFWRKFRAKCNECKKDFYILGENWENSNAWIDPSQFNAVMNYELSYPLWGYFSGDISLEEFKCRISDLFVNYKDQTNLNMFNLFDSHDTQRMFTRLKCNYDLYYLALVFLLSMPGCPSIYYGDEIALEGENDPDNRRCMKWENLNENQTKTRDFFKKMINLRKSNSSFRSIDFKFIDSSCLAYQKQNSIFIINTSDSPKEINIKGKFYDIFNDKYISLDESSKIDKLSFMILRGN